MRQRGKSRALTSFHEGFGHGIPFSRGITGRVNQYNAIKYENMIRRVMGIKTMRNGQNPIHGGGEIVPISTTLPTYR